MATRMIEVESNGRYVQEDGTLVMERPKKGNWHGWELKIGDRVIARHQFRSIIAERYGLELVDL